MKKIFGCLILILLLLPVFSGCSGKSASVDPNDLEIRNYCGCYEQDAASGDVRQNEFDKIIITSTLDLNMITLTLQDTNIHGARDDLKKIFSIADGKIFFTFDGQSCFIEPAVDAFMIDESIDDKKRVSTINLHIGDEVIRMNYNDGLSAIS